MKHINLTLVIPELAAVPGKLSKSVKSNCHSIEQLLLQLFKLDLSAPIPYAAISALGCGLNAHEGWWLRADPVELQVGNASIVMLGNQALKLTQAQVTLLLAELNNLLEHDNLRMFAPKLKEWYLWLATDPQINTYPLAEVVGKDIHGYMPNGKQASHWRKLLTELQMLLYAKTAIDSVWFWGEGQLPQQTFIRNWQQVNSHDSFCKGLALLTKTPLKPLDNDFQTWYQSLSEAGDYLIVINDIDDSEQVKEQWLSPLLKQQHHIRNITIYLGHQHSVVVKKNVWQMLSTRWR